jgi:hypothetical protein
VKWAFDCGIITRLQKPYMYIIHVTNTCNFVHDNRRGRMSFFRFIFVILLCVPLGYLALRLFINLIDSLGAGRKTGRR